MITTYLFFGFALLAVLGALGLIIFKHPMNGAMSFVVTLISLAGLYALRQAISQCVGNIPMGDEIPIDPQAQE